MPVPRPHKRKFTLPRALRARRASELLTKHAATRNQHAPHLDLSPIFPLKYKTKTKIPRANADATLLRGAMNNFSFWDFTLCRCGVIAARRVDGVCESPCTPSRRWRGGGRRRTAAAAVRGPPGNATGRRRPLPSALHDARRVGPAQKSGPAATAVPVTLTAWHTSRILRRAPVRNSCDLEGAHTSAELHRAPQACNPAGAPRGVDGPRRASKRGRIDQ